MICCALSASASALRRWRVRDTDPKSLHWILTQKQVKQRSCVCMRAIFNSISHRKGGYGKPLSRQPPWLELRHQLTQASSWNCRMCLFQFSLRDWCYINQPAHRKKKEIIKIQLHVFHFVCLETGMMLEPLTNVFHKTC